MSVSLGFHYYKSTGLGMFFIVLQLRRQQTHSRRNFGFSTGSTGAKGCAGLTYYEPKIFAKILIIFSKNIFIFAKCCLTFHFPRNRDPNLIIELNFSLLTKDRWFFGKVQPLVYFFEFFFSTAFSCTSSSLTQSQLKKGLCPKVCSFSSHLSLASSKLSRLKAS